MLKLKQNIIPTGTIDGTNKVFEFEFTIGGMSEVKVDGSVTSGYKYQGSTLTLDVAPQSTISADIFERYVSDIAGDGQTTLGSLKKGFYSTIGRVNPDGTIPNGIQRIYPESYVSEELRKSYKRITNNSPETLNTQSYTVRATVGQNIIGLNSDNTIPLSESLSTEVAGIFIVGDSNAVYQYYSNEDGRYQTSEPDIGKLGDKLIIGQRIPTGVKKIIGVRIEGEELENINSEEFTINNSCSFTVVRDFNGNSYLILPFSTDPQNITVKFIPDKNYFTEDFEVVDIPEEYADTIIYDTAVKLLRQKEDERWVSLQTALGDGRRGGLLYEYQSFVKSKIKKTKGKIKINNDNLYDETYIQTLSNRRFNGGSKY